MSPSSSSRHAAGQAKKSSSSEAVGPAKKPRFDLLPGDALREVALAFTHGIDKHEARGWEDGRAWGGEFAAAMRHLWAFWGGEHTDPESGLCHLAHAAARILILLALWKRKAGADDRSTREAKGTADATQDR